MRRNNEVDVFEASTQGAEATVWDAPVEQPNAFFADEAAREIRTAASDLRDRIAKLETQMMAQYTAMAAYTTIAQSSADSVRAELRSDIDRSQSTTIGLVERVRRECADSITGIQVRAGGGDGSDAARLDSLENRFEALAEALQSSIEAQSALAEQMAVLLEEKMHREGWLVANGSADGLSLR